MTNFLDVINLIDWNKKVQKWEIIPKMLPHVWKKSTAMRNK